MDLVSSLTLAMWHAGHVLTRMRIRGRQDASELLDKQARAWPTWSRLNGPAQQERFVIFDLETTGLDDEAQPVEIGAVRIEEGRILLGNQFHRFVRAPNPGGNPQSVITHGLRPEQTESGIPAREAIPAFLDWTGDAVMVAHHAAFDRRILNRILQTTHHIRVQNLILDTGPLARKVASDPPLQSSDQSLDLTLKRFGIDPTPYRHSARGDALLTARLFLILLRKLSQSGHGKLRDLVTLPLEADDH